MESGDYAWLAVPAYVLIWDVKCRRGQMLSQRSRLYRELHPVLWPATIVYVAGHLMHVWSDRYDPLSRLANALGR